MRLKILLICSIFFFFIKAKSQDSQVFVPIFLPPGEVVCSDEDWKLIFYDEFNGTSLDLTKWRTTYPYGPPGDRLHGYDEDSQEFLEAQVYLDENVVVQNGYLRLIAKKENVLYEGYNKSYSSGMIHTRAPFDFLYGKFEIRAKIPYGMGFWPAFWLYGSQGNEIDIFEFGCHAPDKLFTNAHTEETGVHADWSLEHDYNLDFSDDFHIYTLEWGVNVIYFKVDGIIIRKMYRTYTVQGDPLECSDNFAWGTYLNNTLMPDHPLDIIINLAIASETDNYFTDPPNSSTIFPNQFQIDYVRVYQRNPESGYTDLCSRLINGDYNICNGISKTYSLIGAFNNLTWRVSSNLIKQDSSDNSITVKPISSSYSGSAWIEAIDNGSICSQSIPKKSIWIGKPAIPKTNPSGYPTISMQLDTYFNVAITEMKGASTSMSPVWTASGSLEIDHTTPNGCTYHAYTTGTGNFYVKTRNICGYSPSGGGTVSVYSGSGGGGLPRPLSVSPNPANDYIEAYIENLTEEEQLDNEKLHIKIVNSNSIPVYNGTTQQKKFQINTSSFPEGVYYILVQYKNQKYSTTILISR